MDAVRWGVDDEERCDAAIAAALYALEPPIPPAYLRSIADRLGLLADRLEER
jgi:hypothetical protein